MRPGGFEPPTNSLEGCCSIHLSYGRGNDLRNFATLKVCRTYCKHLPAGLRGQPLGANTEPAASEPRGHLLVYLAWIKP